MFTKKSSSSIIVVLVYVDDIIIIGDNKSGIEELKSFLQRSFAIKDLGKSKYFLGMEIAYSSKWLFINQRKYMLDLLKETGKLGAKPVETHVDRAKLNVDGEQLADVVKYQRLVGKLIYLTITSPDITYDVSPVSQFMHDPKKSHMDVVNRILQYLKGSPG
ncbi:PREDICTED: uncharacterized mitochondrial protein AtMg00810-like [Prunus mume]|uniref:Uncharacterized mitochondrial protein AtMg00810-like n=1 Tax=Prunus mume TaxID=102107 RepID=A0ABM1LI09_PRUMU|nr:PREDICTED: uncharacterized mitochondrial protein AtMg00810-like [Prunus mume]